MTTDATSLPDSPSHVQDTPKPRVATPIVPLQQFLPPAEANPPPAQDPEESWRTLQKTYSKPARSATPQSPANQRAPTSVAMASPPIDTLTTQPSVPQFVAMDGGEVLTLSEDEQPGAEEAMEAGPSLSTLGAGAERVVFLET